MKQQSGKYESYYWCGVIVAWAVNFGTLKEMVKHDRCHLLKTNQMQCSSKDNANC